MGTCCDWGLVGVGEGTLYESGGWSASFSSLGSSTLIRFCCRRSWTLDSEHDVDDSISLDNLFLKRTVSFDCIGGIICSGCLHCAWTCILSSCAVVVAVVVVANKEEEEEERESCVMEYSTEWVRSMVLELTVSLECCKGASWSNTRWGSGLHSMDNMTLRQYCIVYIYIICVFV